jgi:hypothetical protein
MSCHPLVLNRKETAERGQVEKNIPRTVTKLRVSMNVTMSPELGTR